MAIDIVKQINDAIGGLIYVGLSDDQNHAFVRNRNDGIAEVTFKGAQYVSLGLKPEPYYKLYDSLKESRAYVVRMADGALVQLMYEFHGESILRHRLAFWPSPHLEQFQNEPEIYTNDEVYAEIVEPGIVPFPVRFDFDACEERFEALLHPKSHLTLGQYTRCRIPVSAPLMPAQFFEFVLRNFYNTAHTSYTGVIPLSVPYSFTETIEDVEKEVVFVQIPRA